MVGLPGSVYVLLLPPSSCRSAGPVSYVLLQTSSGFDLSSLLSTRKLLLREKDMLPNDRIVFPKRKFVGNSPRILSSCIEKPCPRGA